jgi:hypothetical protein
MTSEELAFVTLAGESVSYAHAVLIETRTGWHVELEGVPADSCPFVRGECAITFDTWDGEHYSGVVAASYKAEDHTYVVLTGTSTLACEHFARAEDSGDARASA